MRDTLGGRHEPMSCRAIPGSDASRVSDFSLAAREADTDIKGIQ